MRWWLLVLGLLVAGCGNDSPAPQPPPQPVPDQLMAWYVGPVINGVNYSPGVVWQPDDSFAFPTAAPGVHALLRPVMEPGRNQIAMRFRIDGNATFTEVDAGGGTPGPGKLRLFLQRCGDDWSGGPKASYRFYSAPLALAVGEGELTVRLTPDLWTNVNGQQDTDGFAAALADLCTVGMGFGGMFAMHGVYATGDARFYLISYIMQ